MWPLSQTNGLRKIEVTNCNYVMMNVLQKINQSPWSIVSVLYNVCHAAGQMSILIARIYQYGLISQGNFPHL